jgi:hypothetical protein
VKGPLHKKVDRIKTRQTANSFPLYMIAGTNFDWMRDTIIGLERQLMEKEKQTDLERMVQLFTDMGLPFELKQRHVDGDEAVYGSVHRWRDGKFPYEYYDAVIELFRKGDWFYMQFEFLEGKYKDYAIYE